MKKIYEINIFKLILIALFWGIAIGVYIGSCICVIELHDIGSENIRKCVIAFVIFITDNFIILNVIIDKLLSGIRMI